MPKLDGMTQTGTLVGTSHPEGNGPVNSDARDAINRRLAEIDEELWSLGPGDYSSRYQLHVERDRLRDRVRGSSDADIDRSTEDLLSELDARRKSLKAIQESLVSSAGMSGGGGEGAGSFDGPADGVKLNTEIVAATGAKELAERVAKLETILTERGAI